MSSRAKARGASQCGTLGSGNHYVEVQVRRTTAADSFGGERAITAGCSTLAAARVIEQTHRPWQQCGLSDAFQAWHSALRCCCSCGPPTLLPLLFTAVMQVVDEVFNPTAAEVMGIGKKGTICIMVHSGSRGLGHQVSHMYAAAWAFMCCWWWLGPVRIIMRIVC